MLRRLLFIVLSLGILAGLWYFFDYYQRARKPVREGLDCIPGDAVLILESVRTIPAFQKLLHANQMWEELCTLAPIAELNRDITALDSIFRTRNLDKLLEEHPAYFSLHLRAEEKTSLLFTFALRDYNDITILEQTFLSCGKIAEDHLEGFNGNKISKILFKGTTRNFYYIIHEGVFLGSFSGALVNEALLHCETGLPLDQDPGFSKLLVSAGTRNDANLYIRLNGLSGYLNLLTREGEEHPLFPRDLGSWATMDLSLHTNKLVFNGYTGSETGQWLSAFRQQPVQDMQILEGVPAAVASLVVIGVGDLPTYVDDRIGMELKSEKKDAGGISSLLMNRYGLDPQKSFTGWASNALAACWMKNQDDQGPGVIILSCPDPELAAQELHQSASRIDSVNKRSPEISIYKERTIRKIGAPVPFGTFFGAPFRDLEESWYFIDEELAYFSPDRHFLEETIDALAIHACLARDPSFSRLFQENFSTGSNVFIYSSIPVNAATWSSRLIPDLRTHMENGISSIQKFSFFALQCSMEKDLYYTTCVLGFSPSSKQETATLWEAELDNEVSKKPFLLKNHLNGTKDVLVQDDSSILSQFSNIGKLQWRRKLDGGMMGDPVQVDVFRNGKLQIVFNTQKMLYVMDRNGKDLDGFPVRLPSAASAPVSVFDYDEDLTYRLIIPCMDMKLYNYTIKGKVAERWDPSPFNAPIMLPVKHIRIGKKDHLFAVDNNGKIYWMNRRGESYGNKKLAGIPKPVSWFLLDGKDAGRTQIVLADSTGNITRLSLDGKKESFRLLPHKGKCRIAMCDLDEDGQKDFVAVHDSTVYFINSARKMLSSFQASHEIIQTPLVFRIPGKSGVVGLVLGSGNELILADPVTGIHNTVYKGSAGFSIGDLNKDGTLILVAPARSGRIMAWQLRD